MAKVRLVMNRSGLNHAKERLAEALQPKMQEAAEAVAAEARRRAPVRTGALKHSIQANVQRDGDRITAQVGSPLDYAPKVELGTHRMRSRPYLRPALADLARIWKKISGS